MKPHNSVGGFRIYPSSPQAAELVEMRVALLGQFNEGMERFDTQRQLTQAQQQRINHLDAHSRLSQDHMSLDISSNLVWQLALEKQQYHTQGVTGGQYTTKEMTDILNQYADRWRTFKHQLDEQA